MAFIQWSDQLSVAVPVIDEQHKRLVELANAVHRTVVAGSERSALGRVFDELVSYTVYHFRAEEGLFSRVPYPDRDAHVAQHNAFTQKVLELQAAFDDGSATISYEILDLLADWLVKHIIGVDRKLGRILAPAPARRA